jgi:hypothetical protein
MVTSLNYLFCPLSSKAQSVSVSCSGVIGFCAVTTVLQIGQDSIRRSASIKDAHPSIHKDIIMDEAADLAYLIIRYIERFKLD